MNDDDKIVPITRALKNRGEVLATVGGVVDETRVTLCLYAKDLDPRVMSELLGVSPSRAHRRGDRAGPRSPPFKHGAWFLEEEGRAPLGPQHLVARLLARIPGADAPVWAQVRQLAEIHLWFGIFVVGWNQGFELGPGQAMQLGKIGCRLMFDVYVDDDEPAPGSP